MITHPKGDGKISSKSNATIIMEDSKAKDLKVSNALNQVEVVPVKGFLARAKELDESAAKNKQAKKEASEIAKAVSQPIIKDSKNGPVK